MLQNLLNIHDFMPKMVVYIRTWRSSTCSSVNQWWPSDRCKLWIDLGINTNNNDRGGATVELYDAYSDAGYW